MSVLRSGLSLFNGLFDLLYPRLCVVCDCGLVGGEKYICSDCLAGFPLSDPVFDPGLDLLLAIDEPYRPEKFWSLFHYNKYSDYKKLIYAVKYHSKKDLGRYLGRILGERIKNDCKVDYLIPVPLHPKREKQRGFNQSYQIALGMAEAMQVEVCDDVLVRARNNVSQTGKNAEERHKNVEHIFELRDARKLMGCHILLIDDVVTTGATVTACLKVLVEVPELKCSLACLGRTRL